MLSTSLLNDGIAEKTVKKASILRLQLDTGMVEGHAACAEILEQSVEDLLLHPGQLDQVAQQVLLNEVTPVFTDKDVSIFLTPPSKDDVWDTICDSNLNAAPGTDGIPTLAYKEFWSALGDSLTEVMIAIFNCQAGFDLALVGDSL